MAQELVANADPSVIRGSKKRHEAWRRLILDGAWQPDCPGCISIGQDGRTKDGLGRLNGFILAATERPGLTIEINIAHDVSDTGVDVIDVNWGRTIPFRLKRRGAKHTGQAASIARRVVLWDRGEPATRSFIPNAEEILSAAETAEVAQAAVYSHSHWSSRTRHLTPAIAGFSWLLLRRLAPPEVVDYFLDRLRDGDGLSKGDPILTVRERLLGLQKERSATAGVNQLYLVLKAWSMWCQGRHMFIAKYPRENEGGISNEMLLRLAVRYEGRPFMSPMPAAPAVAAATPSFLS